MGYPTDLLIVNRTSPEGLTQCLLEVAEKSQMESKSWEVFWETLMQEDPPLLPRESFGKDSSLIQELRLWRDKVLKQDVIIADTLKKISKTQANRLEIDVLRISEQDAELSDFKATFCLAKDYFNKLKP